MKTANFIGVTGKKAQPTKQHRPAVWELMLGAVLAMDDNGTVRNFDYDWDAAIEFAGVPHKTDIRIAKAKTWLRVGRMVSDHVRKGQTVLWVEKGGC